MRPSIRIVVAVTTLLAASLPAAAAQKSEAAAKDETNRSDHWDFSLASGLGFREIDGRGYGVPYVAFWAARERSPRLEIVYDGFLLAPSSRTRGPAPIGFAPDAGMEGTSTYVANAIAFGALVRANYYFREGGVRPYVTIGAGIVFDHMARERSRTIRALPDGSPTTTERRDAELRIGLNSVVGLGLKVRVAEGWHLRPEARIPIPWLPPLSFGHPAHSVALVVGVTWSPRDR